MPSAKFTQTYEAVSKMGEKLKAAGKQGPSNDEQLKVCLASPVLLTNILQFSLHLCLAKKEMRRTRTHIIESSLANNPLKQLYAYAKVAQGQDFSAAKKPGMFDLTVRVPTSATHPSVSPTFPPVLPRFSIPISENHEHMQLTLYNRARPNTTSGRKSSTRALASRMPTPSTLSWARAWLRSMMFKRTAESKLDEVK
jgi:hypothetical protein